MDKFKQDNKFWFDFFIIFLLGNIIIGFFALFIRDKIYMDYVIEALSRKASTKPLCRSCAGEVCVSPHISKIIAFGGR